MEIPDDLLVLWDGQPIGRVRVTKRRFDPAKRYGTDEYPAKWFITGEFLPTTLFAECQAAFDECARLERVYDEGPDAGDKLAANEEAMREAMLAIVACVRVPELVGRLHRFTLDEGTADIVFVPASAGRHTEPSAAADGGA